MVKIAELIIQADPTANRLLTTVDAHDESGVTAADAAAEVDAVVVARDARDDEDAANGRDICNDVVDVIGLVAIGLPSEVMGGGSDENANMYSNPRADGV